MNRVPSGSAVTIATGLQFALVLHLSGRRSLALWIAAAAIALFVWQFTRRWSKVLQVLLNAILLSLPVHLYYRYHGGSGSELTGSIDVTLPSEPSGNDGDGSTITADHSFPGVILFPEVQRHATIVPPLPAMRRDIFSPRDRNPLSIPFFGSYWFYKWPQRRLPKNAVRMRGDPDEKRFRSTDAAAMSMEAHQNLGTFIETSCCRSIEIAIRNADRYPGSVTVTLQLMNTSLAGSPSMSLGALPVTANPRYQGKAEQVLHFPMPSSPPLARFDEFSVRFGLAYVRREHSAAMAIERFVLVPRGL